MIKEKLKIDRVNLLEGVPPEAGQRSVSGLSKEALLKEQLAVESYNWVKNQFEEGLQVSEHNWSAAAGTTQADLEPSRGIVVTSQEQPLKVKLMDIGRARKHM